MHSEDISDVTYCYSATQRTEKSSNNFCPLTFASNWSRAVKAYYVNNIETFFFLGKGR